MSLSLCQSLPYESALRRMDVPVLRLGTTLAIRRRIPLLGPLTYIPRGAFHDPDGMTLYNAADADADRQHHAAGHLPLMTPQTLALLEIHPDEATQLAAQHGKWRNRLRRAQEAGLTLSAARFDPSRHNWLLDQETTQRRAQRYTGLSHRFTCAYPRAQTLLIQASRRGQTLAAMLFLLHAPGASYHIGWSNPEGRRLNAHALTLWNATILLRAQGITQIDLGTLDTANAPGLARFKLGSGARAHRLGHTWLHLPALSPRLGMIRQRGGFPSGLLG
ncbi:GNAT family N-acetyltransferase [Thalassobius vesicularis]|uniref:GNAT family N-acetyltransferase n=1 Tax=Thalassobius vesicularis TaxID=1294297 RepID=A0A4S3MAY9_9RHOB|nr:GNAT family N-acetyltransferase [Thalassobius vesicularis]THD74944.1 GNAT family N-acetyltransferase [Thalassobius vesicularis]